MPPGYRCPLCSTELRPPEASRKTPSKRRPGPWAPRCPKWALLINKYIHWPIGIYALWVVFNASRGFRNLGVNMPAVHQTLASYFTAPALYVWGRALRGVFLGGVLGGLSYWLMRAAGLVKKEVPSSRFGRACIHTAAAAAGIAGVYVLWTGTSSLMDYAAALTPSSGP